MTAPGTPSGGAKARHLASLQRLARTVYSARQRRMLRDALAHVRRSRDD